MRKMATIRKISSISAIEGADNIELATVDGWNIVVKKGEYKEGDLAVYCEVDSFVPNNIAPFLTASDRFPKEYLGVKGERLKTKKLRGVISQGLLLPVGTKGKQGLVVGALFGEGDDVSEFLGIVKYDPPLPAQLAGQAKGNFPTLVPKTDEERVQNLSKQWSKITAEGLTYEVTEKLEGSSCTFYLDLEGNFEVCSRNLSLKEDENNSFWKAANMYNAKQKMLDNNLQGYAIQGELIGEGIQGNIYNLKGVDFYVYTIWDVKNSKYLTPKERVDVCVMLGLNHVPVLDSHFKFKDGFDIQLLLVYAEDKSKLNLKQEREGVVLKCNEQPDLHFKAISNKYLLKQKD